MALRTGWYLPCALTLALAALPLAARATVIVVTTTDDELNDDNDCSLREAVVAANTNTAVSGCPAGEDAAIDEIDLGHGTYILTLHGTSEDFAETGDLDIRDPVRIVGQGSHATIIDGDAADRIFDVHWSFDDVLGALQLEDLTVQNGSVGFADVGFLNVDGGGAIRNGRELAGVNLTFAPSPTGRPIAHTAPALSSRPFLCANVLLATACTALSNVAVLDSEAVNAYGGGILNLGELALGGVETISLGADSSLPPPGAGGSSSLSKTTDAITVLHDGVVVSGNTAVLGGGLYNEGLAVTFHATFDDNQAFLGGGIYNEQPEVALVARPSTEPLESIARGLGLHRLALPVILARGNLIVFESTLSRNHAVVPTAEPLVAGPAAANNAPGEGGGLWNQGGAALVDSTVSGNTAEGPGGGIFNDCPGLVTAIFSTIAQNSAAEGGGGVFDLQDMVEVVGGINLQDTIVGKNESDDCASNADTSDVFFSHGGNIDSDDTCNLTETTDKPDTDPKLGPLQNNGGPTETHLPLAGSPAIDMAIDASSQPPLRKQGAAASVDCGLPEDQRVFPRPVDGDGDGTAICDIGAVEVQVDPVPTLDPRGLTLLALVLALGGLLLLRRTSG